MTNFVEEAFKLHLAGDAMGARLYYMTELEENPASCTALMNLSQLAMDEGHQRTAEILTRKALQHDPHNSLLHANLGMLLSQMERFDEADTAVSRSLELGPEIASHWRNAGLLRIRQRRHVDAVDLFRKVIALGDNSHGLRNDLAHAYLALGELHKGLELYESRWAILHHPQVWDYHIPEWQGEELHDQEILISAEQGFGDTIMCMRFLKTLQERYPDCFVTVAVPVHLVSLFKYCGYQTFNIDDIDKDIASTFDFHSPFMSMVRWLEIDYHDISPAPYISLVDTTVKGTNRVGICWASGRRNSDHDWRGRYSSLEDWLPLATLPNVQLVSLQQGQDANDIEKISAGSLISEKEIVGCRDWLATAKVIAGLDYVVSVDTAVAHLAGAMGKPVIMLSQFSNCWRWWKIDDNSGMPWYKNFTIVRQEEPKDWAGCLDNAYYTLECLIEEANENEDEDWET